MISSWIEPLTRLQQDKNVARLSDCTKPCQKRIIGDVFMIVGPLEPSYFILLFFYNRLLNILNFRLWRKITEKEIRSYLLNFGLSECKSNCFFLLKIHNVNCGSLFQLNFKIGNHFGYVFKKCNIYPWSRKRLAASSYSWIESLLRSLALAVHAFQINRQSKYSSSIL